MKVRIDKAGRLVLPKAVRELLGITPQTPLEIVPSGDGVLLRRVAERPAMQQAAGLWVHQGTADPGIDWGSVIDKVRQQRADST